MIWQPPDRDIHPFEKILSLAVRDLVLAFPGGNMNGPVAWRDVRCGETALNLALRVSPLETRSHKGRAALAYGVSGDAVWGRAGYRCEGEALIDLRTRAFLAVECRMIPVGAVEGAGAAERM